jgi:hypothetical protein
MATIYRQLALVILTLGILVSGVCVSAPASAQDAQQEGEQAEGEQGEGESAEGEEAQQDEQDPEAQGPSLRRGNRMEFDARLIRGESAGSGAVFLFERGQRPLPSMIDKRKSFLRDTVGSVLGSQWAAKFKEAQSQDTE